MLYTKFLSSDHLVNFKILIAFIAETLHVARSNNGQDFDSFLIDIANKFEKADNKGPLIGWTVASFFAITTVEWLIHLPLFDFLIGFPLQFLGIISAINLGLKYYVDKRGDPASDIKDIVESVAKQLPGIGK